VAVSSHDENVEVTCVGIGFESLADGPSSGVLLFQNDLNSVAGKMPRASSDPDRLASTVFSFVMVTTRTILARGRSGGRRRRLVRRAG